MNAAQAELYAEARLTLHKCNDYRYRKDDLAELIGKLADALLEATTGPQELAALTHLELNPGDVLAVTYQQNMSPDALAAMAAGLEEHLPGVRALVLDGGPTLHVLSSGRVVELAVAQGFPAS